MPGSPNGTNEKAAFTNVSNFLIRVAVFSYSFAPQLLFGINELRILKDDVHIRGT